ncbi:MAG: TIGR04552 family protein [Bdellovibrionaceae bacterium]|nr:TIGR04552 family protein [Bdellovibrio sp.]
MIGHHSSFYFFDESSLGVVAAGASAIDRPFLHIHSLEEAEAFLRSYGYKVNNPENLERLWYFHRRALVLMTERLKLNVSDIPAQIKSKEELKDIRYLLIYASQFEDKKLQRWSCAFLRCMHVFVHAETDLFSSFSEEIQKQILGPFEQAVFQDDKLYLKSFQKEGHPRVELLDFHSKPFKTSTSTVIKLLARPEALAMKIFDKIGVRFVTKTVFDSFQVIRFLVEENIISFPQIMPDQSSNNMYPVEEFLAVCNKLVKKHGDTQTLTPEKIDRLLAQRLKSSQSAFLGLFRKDNPFSSEDFKYIKFISRQLIQINSNSAGGRTFNFFYPFEVQIMNESSYKKMQSGESEHNAYKDRQVEAAIKRLFPE